VQLPDRLIDHRMIDSRHGDPNSISREPHFRSDLHLLRKRGDVRAPLPDRARADRIGFDRACFDCGASTEDGQERNEPHDDLQFERATKERT
jgi:hypothetical protein